MASKYKRNGVWYVKWFVGGVRHRQSTYSRDVADANRLMEIVEAQKLAAKQRGLGMRPTARVSFSELLDDLDADYAANRRRSCRDLYYRGEVIRKRLGGYEVYPTATITAGVIVRFRDGLLRDGLQPATVNRYLAVVSRAFTLAAENERILVAPRIKRLREAAPRTNWWTDGQIEAFLKEAPDYLRNIVIFAALVSWRRGDILGLRREWCDGDIIRIPPGETKGGEPRVYVVPEHLRDILRGNGEYIFHRGNGRRIRSIRTVWDNTLDRANLKGQGLTFHALRRTARRLIERAGITDRVGMSIMGHKTRWVYDNYRVVPQQDLEEAARRMDKSAPKWASVDKAKEPKG